MKWKTNQDLKEDTNDDSEVDSDANKEFVDIMSTTRNSNRS